MFTVNQLRVICYNYDAANLTVTILFPSPSWFYLHVFFVNIVYIAITLKINFQRIITVLIRIQYLKVRIAAECQKSSLNVYGMFEKNHSRTGHVHYENNI